MIKNLIRTSGIEPESHPWKGGVLPLYYVRVVLFFILFCACAERANDTVFKP